MQSAEERINIIRTANQYFFKKLDPASADFHEQLELYNAAGIALQNISPVTPEELKKAGVVIGPNGITHMW